MEDKFGVKQLNSAIRLDSEGLKMLELESQTRGGAVWQLVGLITRRSQVQILSPQPNSRRLLSQLTQKPFCFLLSPSFSRGLRDADLFNGHSVSKVDFLASEN